MSAFGSGPSNGQFWYGSQTNFPGFLYKKNVGVGGRRSTKMGPGGNVTCNSATDLYNKYKPGTGGVGASSTANRRAKNRLSTICGSSNKCFPCYNTLGQYSNYTHNPNGFIPCPGTINIISSSGSVTPTPTPTPSITYNLLYRTPSGSGSPPAPTTPYSGGTNITILPNNASSPFVSGSNQFGGWNTAPNGTGTYYPAGSTLTMPYANTALWAQWYNPAATSYQVIYNGNGSTGGTAPGTVSYNQYQGVGITGNTGSLTNGSLTFYGWNTAANGLGTAYPVTSNGFTMPAANVTLYAQWVNTSITWNLTYNGNGNTDGSVPAPQTSYPSGAGVGVLGQSSLVRSGYTFLGWNTVANGTGANYSSGQSIVMSSDKTLYAQWVGGSVAKTCGSSQGGSSTTTIGAAYTKTVYRDNTNNTITAILPIQYNNNSGPYGTGTGPIDTSHTGNILNSYSKVELSQVSGIYTINITYGTNWTGQSEIQTGTLTLTPTYWPTTQTINDITITNTLDTAGFSFSTSPTPPVPIENVTVASNGCFSSCSNSGTTTTNISIIAFYINFNNGTSTRIAIGVQNRWVGTNNTTTPITLIYNRTRVEIANGLSPSSTGGTFPSSGTLTTTSVNSA